MADKPLNQVPPRSRREQGRDRSSVRTAPDFVASLTRASDERRFASEELRLFYVALTRARIELDIPDAIIRSRRIRWGTASLEYLRSPARQHLSEPHHRHRVLAAVRE